MKDLLRLAFCVAVLAAAAGTTAAQSSTAGVHDAAGLFQPEVVARMNEQINDLQRIYHRDLLIETIKVIPQSELAVLLPKSSRSARSFASWTRQLAEEHDVNGVYVLISAHPQFQAVSVTARPEDASSGLGPHSHAICNEIYREFVNREKRSGPNIALKELVERVESRFSANLSEERAAASSLSWETILEIILGVLLFWLLAAVVRRKLAIKSAGSTAGEEPGEPKTRPGMLGGMFGSVASQWIYDAALKQDAPASDQAGQAPSVSQTGFPLPLQSDQIARPAADDLPQDELMHQAEHDRTEER